MDGVKAWLAVDVTVSRGFALALLLAALVTGILL